MTKIYLVLVFISFSPLSALCQWRTDTVSGGKMTVRRTNYSTPYFTITDNKGGTLHFFTQLVDQPGGGATYAIKMQRCDSSAALQLATVDSGLSIQPVINEIFDAVSDGTSGAYLLYSVWSDQLLNQDSFYLFLQHVDNNGQLLWGSWGKQVSRQLTSFNFSGKLHLYGDASVAAVFNISNYADNGYGQLYAQKYSAAGNALWGVNPVAVCTAVERRGMHYLTHDGGGGLLVVFEDGRSGSFSGNAYDNMDIYMQHINSNGSLANNAAGVAVVNSANPQRLYQEKPAEKYIYPDGAGGCYFLYETESLANSDINDIYVQRINAAGQPVWTSPGVLIVRSDYSGRYVYAKDMAAPPSGGISVLYNTSDGTGYYSDPTELRLQTISTAGAVQYPAGSGKKIATVFNTGYSEYSAPFDIAYTASGEAWILFNKKDDSIHLKMQKLRTDGTLAWDSAGKTVIRHETYLPQIKYSSNGNYLIRWFDRRNYAEWDAPGSADVFLGQFDGNGAFVSSRNVITSASGGNWNNPATWVGGIVPGPNDIVKVLHNITVTANTSCYSVSVLRPNGSLVVQTGISFLILH